MRHLNVLKNLQDQEPESFYVGEQLFWLRAQLIPYRIELGFDNLVEWLRYDHFHGEKIVIDLRKQMKLCELLLNFYHFLGLDLCPSMMWVKNDPFK